LFTITAELKGIKTTEGNYKNKQIAEKHKRRLERKNPGIYFGLEKVDKINKNNIHVFKAVKGHIERGEL